MDNITDIKPKKKVLTKRKKLFAFYKALGENNTQACIKAGYKNTPRKDNGYPALASKGSVLMKDSSVLQELAIYKDVLRKEALPLAVANMKRILQESPKDSLKWDTWLKATVETMKLSGLNESESQAKATQKVEFIKQFFLNGDRLPKVS